MYRVSIYNNGIETLIHLPTSEKDAPHILNLPFKESLSRPEQLSFSIPINNPGFDIIQELRTKVKVFDTRDNSVIFSGRVIPITSGMTSDGSFSKGVVCEGALSYLNDSHTRRWNFTNQTPSQILQYLLDRHNEKMDVSRKIYIGTIEVNQPITIDTNHETTLNAIITKVRNILGGDIRVVERNGYLYLDYLLAQGANNNVEVSIGYNLREIIREYDPMDVITRGIPLGYGEGINQLGIESVNGNIEYIEDSEAISKYGVIEGVITNKDIQNADTLKIYGQTVLNEKKQPRFTYRQRAFDLSVLPGHEHEKYDLGDTLHTSVDILNIDVYSRVIERERDLISNPWDPYLTISTRPIMLTDQTIELKQRNQSLENAPQGSTYIDTFGYGESIDAGHPFQLPIWLSPDILNVNRVRLHIDGQKYRAYEKGMESNDYISTSSGPSSSSTSDSSSSSTSGSSSKESSTVEAWSAGGWRPAPSGPNQTMYLVPLNHDFYQSAYDQKEGLAKTIQADFQDPDGTNATYRLMRWIAAALDPTADLYDFQHRHDIKHTHTMEHTHGMEHTHEIEIDGHTHPLNYGIFEDKYPRDVYVKINGQTIAGPYHNIDQDGIAQSFSIDLDLTPFIRRPGETYNLEITSSQNGRINAWVSIQAFIQAK